MDLGGGCPCYLSKMGNLITRPFGASNGNISWGIAKSHSPSHIQREGFEEEWLDGLKTNGVSGIALMQWTGGLVVPVVII